MALAFSGCAGQAHRVKDDGVQSGDTGNVKIVQSMEKKEEPVIVDDTGEFELIDTPFGYIKRPINQTTGRVPASSVAPVKEASPPSPPSLPESKIPDKVVKAKPPVNVPPPRTAQEPLPETISSEKGKITFNFDNADIYEVIGAISELLHINYIVDPDVRGKVTIRTMRGLGNKDIFPVFRQILEANGLTIVREGPVYKIVNMKDVSRMPITLRSELDVDESSSGERIIIQVIPLKYITVEEMTKLLTPFVSSTGAIISDSNSNTLLVVDKGLNILKAMNLVDVFDVSLLEKVHHRFYFFKNIDAEDAAKVLKEISSSYPTGRKESVKLIAITRLNAVLAITSQAELLEMLDTFVAQMDIPSESAEPRIYVYSVKNGEAEQLATLLNTIFGKGSEKTSKDTKEITHPNPLAMGSKEKESKLAEQSEAVKEVKEVVSGNASGSVMGEINITPDEVRNALIIKAIPRDYKVVTDILERLDVLPRQVLIEATVAEITLGKDYEMGVEWTFKNTPWTEKGSLSAAIGAAGLSYAIGLTEKWQATLSALEQDNRVNILSSPHVLASDNKEAQIDISTEIPVASTEYTYSSSGDTNGVLETSIEYRDTGVILKVTPHINERGLVTMDISQEVSEQSSNVSVGGSSYPSFYKRSVNTTLTVKHGQTLVIGGLIRETESDAMAGVPCLIDIPLLRYFFGKDKQGKEKTEMIVMITPRVIVSLEDIDAVTEEFKAKVAKVKERMEDKGKEKKHPLF